MSARDQIEVSLGRINYDRALVEVESARNWVKRELQKIRPDPNTTSHCNVTYQAEAAIEAYTIWSRRLYVAALGLCNIEESKEEDLTWEVKL